MLVLLILVLVDPDTPEGAINLGDKACRTASETLSQPKYSRRGLSWRHRRSSEYVMGIPCRMSPHRSVPDLSSKREMCVQPDDPCSTLPGF